MRSSRPLLAALAAGMLLSGPVAAAGDATAGAGKAETCLGCHDVKSYFNVYPSYHVPKIWGQHPDYIVAALKAYAAGKRNHDTMKAQAASLSEQDMRDIAAFFADQKGK